jgi:hypothetical protein
VAVGESCRADRCRPGAGLALADEGVDRLPQRRVERGARAALGREPLEVVGDVGAEHLADDSVDRLRALSRQQAAVDDDLAERRDDVSLLRRGDHRRRERRREQRLDELGCDRMHGTRALDDIGERRNLAEHHAQERLHLLLQLRLRPVGGDPPDQRRGLHEALSAIPGIDAWPERPCTLTLNGAVIFSAVEQR